jgi:16S rRNA (adenine1518-N6/adenine1519-N6)-dimethyltransferase
MDLTSQKTIQNILLAQGIRPRKGLGQNFLVSKGVLGDIFKAANLKKSDTVLEIGPGIGTLTRELALGAKRVIAVEKDPAMVEILKETTQDLQNIEIIRGDILKQNLISLSYPHLNLVKFKVVANLPYYITSPVIRLFLEAENKPELLVLMVQKEVAQRICAKPRTRTSSVRGRPPMNLLAVSVQFYAEPEIISYVKQGCFWPQPKVDSAILKIIPTPTWIATIGDFHVKVFWDVVKAGFKQPRKQLGNNLASGLKLSKNQVETWLSQAGIQPTQRAETLSIEDWVSLAKSPPRPKS